MSTNDEVNVFNMDNECSGCVLDVSLRVAEVKSFKTCVIVVCLVRITQVNLFKHESIDVLITNSATLYKLPVVDVLYE
jgi:hypothetical protein